MDKQAIRMKCLDLAMKFAEVRPPQHGYQQAGLGQLFPAVTYDEKRLLEVAKNLEAYICAPEKRKPAARKR